MALQDTTPDKPAHTPGTPRGEDQAGRKNLDRFAEDATGINVDDRKPIDSRMPSLPPA